MLEAKCPPRRKSRSTDSGIVLSSAVDLVGVRRIGERTHSSGATRRFPARQAAHEEFAAGVPLPLLWIGTAGGGQARAVGLPLRATMNEKDCGPRVSCVSPRHRVP